MPAYDAPPQAAYSPQVQPAQSLAAGPGLSRQPLSGTLSGAAGGAAALTLASALTAWVAVGCLMPEDIGALRERPGAYFTMLAAAGATMFVGIVAAILCHAALSEDPRQGSSPRRSVTVSLVASIVCVSVAAMLTVWLLFIGLFISSYIPR